MAFEPGLAAKLIEFLEPKLEPEEFQELLAIIEDCFTIEAPADLASDAALRTARQGRGGMVIRGPGLTGAEGHGRAAAEFYQMFPDASRLG